MKLCGLVQQIHKWPNVNVKNRSQKVSHSTRQTKNIDRWKPKEVLLLKFETRCFFLCVVGKR